MCLYMKKIYNNIYKDQLCIHLIYYWFKYDFFFIIGLVLPEVRWLDFICAKNGACKNYQQALEVSVLQLKISVFFEKIDYIINIYIKIVPSLYILIYGNFTDIIILLFSCLMGWKILDFSNIDTFLCSWLGPIMQGFGREGFSLITSASFGIE